MDWGAFVSAVIGSIAWPAAVVAAIAILRRPIARLIPLLRRLRYRDLEIDFEKRVEEVVARQLRALERRG